MADPEKAEPGQGERRREHDGFIGSKGAGFESKDTEMSGKQSKDYVSGGDQASEESKPARFKVLWNKIGLDKPTLLMMQVFRIERVSMTSG